MKALPLLTLLLLVSCSGMAPHQASMDRPSAVSAERFPASTNKFEDLQLLASNIVQSGSEQEAQDLTFNLLDSNKEAYLRGYDLLKKFDTDLDQSVERGEKFEIAENGNYQKLLVVWDLRTRIREKVTFLYYKAMKHSKLEGKHSISKKVISSFSRYLTKVSPAEKLAQGDIYSDLQTVELFFKSKPTEDDFARVDNGDVNWIFEKTAHLQPKDVIDYAKPAPGDRFILDPNGLSVKEQKNADKELARMAKVVSETNTEISKEIDEEAATLKYESNERQPQSVAKYAPGPGKTGNLTGSEFPINTWAITFDDGPHNSRTMTVVNTLKENGVSGTFFELGQTVRSLPSVSKEVAKANTIANHTMSHPQLTKISGDQVRSQITQTSDLIQKATGSRPKFMRCPYGAGMSNATVRDAIAKEGMIHVFWNVDTLDWQDKNPQSIVDRAMKQMIANKRGIVLFHDIHPQSVQAIGMLLAKTKEITKSGKGTYHWKSLPAIVNEMNAGE